jgi:hypothetical protein
MSSCNFDRLDTDLDLYISGPDGYSVTYSGSWDNNYELVDFVAQQTGQYTIGVYKRSASEDSNFLGIAWVKDATYLPDLRNNNGWNSKFYVRNDSAQWRQVFIYYSDANGNPTPKNYDYCNLNPNQWCLISVLDLGRIPAGTTGSAIVGGGEDASVVVEQLHTQHVAAFTGLRPPGQGDPNWESVGADVYLPYVYRHDAWQHKSQVTMFNTGATDTNVYMGASLEL